MKLLLDTNVLLYWQSNSPKYTGRLKEIISNPENALFFSPISIWECEIKIAKGRLQVSGDLLSELRRHQVTELAFTTSHAKAISLLPSHHDDPFDRALVAQAFTEKLTLLTADKKLANYDLKVELV